MTYNFKAIIVCDILLSESLKKMDGKTLSSDLENIKNLFSKFVSAVNRISVSILVDFEKSLSDN